MNSKNNNFSFVSFQANDLLNFTSIRQGEKKIGEMCSGNFQNSEKHRYLILGICEDLGPQANAGNGGTDKAFMSFLPKFLSIQSNEFLSGEEVFCPGYVKANVSFSKEIQTKIVSELDEFIVELLNQFSAKNLLPIVIGGGHNNAFPLLNYFSKAKREKIAAVNCDAHADFRETDFRHSGNPFSFANQLGLSDKYAVLGLHQSYNNQFIINKLRETNSFFTFYDDLIYQNKSIVADFEKVLNYFENRFFGIELDMDAIEYMPSSASSPSGISILEARQYISFFAKSRKALYLHLPEAAPKNQQEELYVGKTLAYLVSDFIKNNSLAQRI